MGIADRDYMREKKVRWDERSGEMRLDDDEPERQPRSGAVIGWMLTGLAVLGVAGGGIWWYRHSMEPARPATARPGSGCQIKGNIGARGKIYHVPGSTWYEKTQIDESQGERWFCTEEEARAAGWRPPGEF